MGESLTPLMGGSPTMGGSNKHIEENRGSSFTGGWIAICLGWFNHNKFCILAGGLNYMTLVVLWFCDSNGKTSVKFSKVWVLPYVFGCRKKTWAVVICNRTKYD
ncbi:unnamed protein product [Eretmochelys imbricata]